MLAEIGVGSIDDLFSDIPESIRLKESLGIPAGLSEQEVFIELSRLAAKNTSTEDEITFLGAGMYDHYIPALIDSITSRSEFLTPYTPYQPEVSQGGLQVMFEYQTAISELTGLPVSNASVYEGHSAVSAAAYLAKLSSKRKKLVISRGAHPHTRETLKTHAFGYQMEVVEVALDECSTEPEKLRAAIDKDTAAVVIQQPNFLGSIEDIAALSEVAKSVGALTIVSCDPITLGVLEAPGNQGADVVVGEGQTLGNRLDFGGPSFGFFAADEKYIRQMPGRIAGQTTDVDGRRGFVLTLQTREQHIRREKATSNICTAQALNALAGAVYLSWLGKQGVVELAELLAKRTAYARERLASVEGVNLLHSQPTVREFAVAIDTPIQRVVDICTEKGINPGYILTDEYPEYGEALLIAITEKRTRSQIDQLVQTLAEAVATASKEGNLTGVTQA